MPVPSAEQFSKMLVTAKEQNFAYPAINVATFDAANAALEAFEKSGSDGIIQVSLGGAKFLSGPAEDCVIGAISLAEHVHRVSKKMRSYVALHTDHCQLGDIDFVYELLEVSKSRLAREGKTLFNGHMFDGSALPLRENLKEAFKLLELSAPLGIIPEFEAGVVGGEEEGAASTENHAELYTTPEDMELVAETLFPLKAKFMFAATFGNVHGIYKPGNVKLNPEILRLGQERVGGKLGVKNPFFLVFHGGSGTPTADIRATLNYGVVKMNIDTATQYSFSRAVVEHVFKNYDGMLMIDGEMGDKKLYDPRAYLKKAKVKMGERVVEGLKDLCSLGKSLNSLSQ
jgi:fructose-bisphosphate aldolase, class II